MPSAITNEFHELPAVTASFFVRPTKNFFGTGLIFGFDKLSAAILSLSEGRGGLNMLIVSPIKCGLGGGTYASYAAAAYALELWCIAYIEHVERH